MTRDGLIEVNETKETAERVSRREREADFSKLVTGAMLPDIIFGSLATLIGAIGTWMLGKAALGKDEKQKKLFTWLSPLPPILANAVIIPPVLKYAYGILPMWFSVITVTAGEIISCGIFGLILLAALKKYKNQLFPV